MAARNPYKYKAEFAVLAAKLCQTLGATDTEVAEVIGVDRKTIRRWRAAHPAFDKAMQIAITPANANVEMSLYKQAQGFWIDTEEVKVVPEVIKTKTGAKTVHKVLRIPTRTFIPPSTSAAIFWTKVKMGWRENDMPKPPEGESPQIDGMGIRSESTRQIARRIALILYQAGQDIDEVAA